MRRGGRGEAGASACLETLERTKRGAEADEARAFR